jgi:3-oxoadipate enol-lactonase/4-carboxymuconolactone decarboxylase
VTQVPTLTAVDLTPAAPSLPLLVVGPSLGTSAETLWSAAAAALAGRFHVVGWDLPGHGHSAPAFAPFTIADLAEAVWAVVRATLAGRGDPDGAVHYAGDSLGGAVGLQLLLERPAWRFPRATLLSTGARIGTPDGWRQRAAQVRASGTASLLEATPARWFGPGFSARRPQVAQGLLDALAAADDASYAWACEALAEFDVRHLLFRIGVPVLAVAGAHDVVTLVSDLEAIAVGVPSGRLAVLDVGHLAPAEAPEEVAALLTGGPPRQDPLEAGLSVRRAVLGDAHVDRSLAAATEVTRDFQEFITRYAWGGVWTRPGLDRRQRSLITLTALVALGHSEELALHLRGARRNGLSVEEIRETLLQTAIYCGIPAANTAFRVAQQVLADERADGRPEE